MNGPMHEAELMHLAARTATDYLIVLVYDIEDFVRRHGVVSYIVTLLRGYNVTRIEWNTRMGDMDH